MKVRSEFDHHKVNFPSFTSQDYGKIKAIRVIQISNTLCIGEDLKVRFLADVRRVQGQVCVIKYELRYLYPWNIVKNMKTKNKKLNNRICQLRLEKYLNHLLYSDKFSKRIVKRYFNILWEVSTVE